MADHAAFVFKKYEASLQKMRESLSRPALNPRKTLNAIRIAVLRSWKQK